MKIIFKINSSLPKDEVEIQANQRTPEIDQLIDHLSHQDHLHTIKAKHNDEIFILDFSDIYTFRIEDRILYAQTEHQTYTIPQKLYEVKSQATRHFIQISKSEIINDRHIHHLELEKNGIIKIHFTNQTFTHSSRRYLKQIKEHLNL